MNNYSTYSTSRVNTINPSRQHARRYLQSVDVFIFLVGAFSSFYIDLIGQLYISEIVLILLFPFQLLRRWKVLLKDQLTRKILFFGSLWFVSQVFTDLIRDTSTNDMLRGWAGILVLLVTCSSLYLLTKKNVQRIQFLIFGYAVGALAALYFQPPLYFSEEPWKFGLGYPITLLVLLFISYTSGAKLRNLSKWMLPLLIIGGLFIYLNARSLGAMIILTAIVIWLRNRKFGKVILTHLGVRNALAGGLLLGLTIWGLISIYGYAAQNGYLGDEAQWKYVRQSSGRFGLLLGGRSEIFASVIAVRDSPVIGYGSWAKGPAYRMFLYRVIDLGYERSQEEMSRYINQSDLIPAHSHVFQSWIWAGILGAIFWLVIFGIVIQVLIQSNRYINILYTFVIFMSVCSIWDIFFSPFGSVMRLRWAIQFIVFLAAMSYAAQVQAGPERRQEPGTRQS